MKTERPKILYKYMTPNRAFEVLCTGKIYCPKSEKLNDPFDNSIHVSSEINTIQYITLSIASLKKEGKSWKEIKEALDNVLTDDFEVTEVQKNKILETYKRYIESNEKQGILCLSENCTSLLMWAHYGVSHSGVCIGFEVNVENFSGDEQTCYPVIYSDNYPEANFTEIIKSDGSLTEKTQCTKSIDWSYEKEWRLFVDDGNMLYDVPGKICQIIYGLRTSQDDKTKIELCIKKNLTKIGSCISDQLMIMQCQKADRRFEIEREKLQFILD